MLWGVVDEAFKRMPEDSKYPWVQTDDLRLVKYNYGEKMIAIRMLPEQTPRMESGPVQFGEDWPGVFIRGDHAGYYALNLQFALDKLKDDPITWGIVEGLRREFASCIVG
jgi:hypothetical protein